MPARIAIPTGAATNAEIEIGGHRIERAVRGFTLRADVGQLTVLELDLVFTEGADFDGEVQVVVPEETAEALVAIGWMPPANATARTGRAADAVPAGAQAQD